MLDISIEDFYKKFNSDQKIQNFLDSSDLITIQEKIDGTKLTLLRNNIKYSPSDYTKNWIIAYKGNIIYSSEFDGLQNRDFEIKNESIGTSQYKFIHDKLKKAHENCSEIPCNIEFFIEFAQNKPTLTRDYANLHRLFLIGFSRNIEYDINDGILTTSTTENDLNTDKYYLTRFKLDLNLLILPEWNLPPNINSIFRKYANDLLNKNSILGGKIEGLIIKNERGEIYKILQSDQHDKNIRFQKKQRYKLDPEQENIYWESIQNVAKCYEQARNYENTELSEFFSMMSQYCYNHQLTDINNSKKTLLNKQDDLFLTTKLLFLHNYSLGIYNSIGLIPMSGKPIHMGHWKLIKKAAKENDVVIIFVSLVDRIKKDEFPIFGKEMLYIWKKHLRQFLPMNVKLKFDNQPIVSMFHEIEFMEQYKKDLIINIYSDDIDIVKLEKQVDDKFSNSNNQIITNGINRSLTTDISGTKMRELLQQNKKEEFMKYLPDINRSDREHIWNILRNA